MRWETRNVDLFIPSLSRMRLSFKVSMRASPSSMSPKSWLTLSPTRSPNDYAILEQAKRRYWWLAYVLYTHPGPLYPCSPILAAFSWLVLFLFSYSFWSISKYRLRHLLHRPKLLLSVMHWVPVDSVPCRNSRYEYLYTLKRRRGRLWVWHAQEK